MKRTRDLAHASSPLVRVVLILSVAILLIGITGLQLAGASSSSKDKDSKQGTAKGSKGAPTFKPQATSGSTSLYTLQGSGAATSNGDYISSTAGLDTSYHYFIEVPPGLSSLQVDLFDADIGAGGTAEAAAGRDRDRGGFDTTATYTLTDPSGTARTTKFTTGSTTLPVGADNAWLNFFTSGTGNTVRDNFGTNAYTNQDGNQNWSTNWTETNDDGSATAGDIRVTGGELRIGNNGGGTAPSIARQANLSASGLNLTTAFLSFSYRTSGNLEAGDTLVVEVSSNGGTTFSTLETFTDDSTGTRNYDISSFIAANTQVRFRVTGGYNDNSSAANNEFFFADNVQITDVGPATAGHWELKVDMSSAASGGGDDINALGIRAHDGTAGASGTELNVYYDSQNGFGVNPPTSGTQSKSYTVYPYITSGCSCSKNDFDYDSNSGNTGSINFTSRQSVYTQNYTSASLSANDTWDRRTFSGYTNDGTSADYGIWKVALTITSYLVNGTPNGNYTVFWVGNSNAAANPPAANPTTNAFRVYLPTDSGTAPLKPHLSQILTYTSGSNPPANGQTTVFTVSVRVVNPTPYSVTFSATNLVTANVPGGGTTYNGNASVSQGTITAQPAVGGTGNITWNPGTVAAGATATLQYRVNVRPTAAGQRVVATATAASGNGTRATFVDETGNTTQARATYTLGPLCELAATEGVNGPTATKDLTCTASAYPDGVSVEWTTSYEVDNLGFNVYRDEHGEKKLVNKGLVGGSALLAGPRTALTAGMHYKLLDKSSGDEDGVSYWIEDVDLNGDVTMHGPFPVSAGGERTMSAPSDLLNQVGTEAAADRGNDYQAQHEYSPPAAGYPTSKAVRLAAAKASSDLAGQRAAKISIKQDGWYRVPISDLIAAGLDSNLNPAYLQVYVQGQEQAASVSGAIPGVPDSGDLEFYATGQDTPYTNAHTYWVVAGNQPGLRVGLAKSPGTSAPSGSFPYTVELKERLVFFAALNNGDAENFFGRIITPTPTDQQLTLNHVDGSFSGGATLEVSLQGVTELPGNTDHQVLVKVNNAEAGRMMLDGREKSLGTFGIPQALLVNGTNTVTLTSEGGSNDISVVDYIRITYHHTFLADQDALKFTMERDFRPEAVGFTRSGVAIGGFTSPLIRVLDITNPFAPKELVGDITQGKDGFIVSVETTDPLPRTMIATTLAALKKPAGIIANNPSNLRSPANLGDMVIITHDKLIGSAAPLKALREKQGLNVAVIDVEDIYDEFNFGEKTPKAIRDFLSLARSWKRPPRFVLLLGDASFDPKNYLGVNDLDLVPTKLVATALLETASDDWFTDFNQDGIADVPTGRLPVQTVAEADSVVSKIVAYEKALPNPLNRRAILIADRNDGYDFENATNQLSGLLPVGTPVERIYRARMDDVTARTAVIQAINSGSMVVNYSGHGSSATWRGDLMDASAANQLNNPTLPPFVISMTCLNGLFVDPYTKCLGELLIESTHGGAIAVWGSSALTDPGQQAVVNQEAFRQLFRSKGSPPTIGEAVLKAKLVTNDVDVRQTWILLGDPAIRLR
jgi:peptidase C25-like protein